jgi:EAL domain-containing protein (putative c-di-GMP-specific phosphodiesterase class I)
MAEGIDTKKQLETLLELGFTHGQGQLIAAPMPGSDVANWLRLTRGYQEIMAPTNMDRIRQLH